MNTYNRDSRKPLLRSPNFFNKMNARHLTGVVSFVKTRIKEALDGMAQKNTFPEIKKIPGIVSSQNVLSRVVPLGNNSQGVSLTGISVGVKKSAVPILHHKKTPSRSVSSKSGLTSYPVSSRSHAEVTKIYLQSSWQEIILNIQEASSIQGIVGLISEVFLKTIRSIEAEESRAYKTPIQIIGNQGISLLVNIHKDSFGKYSHVIPEIQLYIDSQTESLMGNELTSDFVVFSARSKDLVQVNIQFHVGKDFNTPPLPGLESYHVLLKKGVERMAESIVKKIEQIETETARKYMHEGIGVYDTELYNDYIDIMRRDGQRFCEYFLAIHPDCSSIKNFGYTVEQGILRTIGERLKKINPKRVFLADRDSIVFLEIGNENMSSEVLNVVSRFNTNGQNIEVKIRENQGKI